VFLGRRGYGPLRTAWDTNILIDYAEFGNLIWDENREFDPPISEAHYRSELLAFCAIVQLSEMRDIRIRVPKRQVYDAQRELDEYQWELRAHQIHHILAALTCIQLDKQIFNEVRPFDTLPEGSSNDQWDESLVLEAIETGCHVFLTRDRRLRSRLHQTAHESFLAIMSPSELKQALEDAGDFAWGWSRIYLSRQP